MLHIVYGMYRWKPKRLAVRNDYCLNCDLPRRAVLLRTFNTGHIYWIPLLPLGFWKGWFCSTCGHNPHVNVKTRRGFKWLGLFLLLLFSALFWITPPDPELGPATWVFRVGGPIGSILTLWHLLRTRSNPSFASNVAAIPPAADTLCPFCGVQLITVSSVSSCPKCGVIRE